MKTRIFRPSGDTVIFPMTLRFDLPSRKAETLSVELVMVASSPTLDAEVRSNLLDVSVGGRPAAGR